MLCVDCRIRPAMYRRTRCNLCAAGAPAPPIKQQPYRPKDHAGKREKLRALIERAKQQW